MARRCGCSGTCSCLLVAGEGIVVEGIGSIENPYQISSDAADLIERIEFEDSQTVDFTASGIGSGANPMTVTAVARVATSELTDVQGVPDSNDVLVWVIDHWEPQPMPVALPPGGTTGQVLTKADDTDGNATWVDVPDELPPGGAIGQVLTKQTAADGSVFWATPASGGGGAVGEPTYAASRASNAAFSVPTGASHTIIPFEVAERNDGITWDAVNNAYTIPVTGWYKVVGTVQYGSHAAGYRLLAIYLNGAQVGTVTDIPAAANGGQSLVVTKDLYLTAGDKVSLRTAQTSGAALALSTTSYNFFSITKIPASIPQQVALGEQNYAISYRQAAAVSCANGAIVQVPWDTLDYTEGGITKDGAGNFTVPVAGYYQINAKVAWDANGNGYRRIRIGVNTASAVPGYGFAIPTVNGTPTCQISRTVKLAAGDTIQVSIDQGSGGTLATVASTPNNSVDITKVPAPVVAGSAASGVWGTAPLNVYGSNDLVGREVYVDSRGQLRSLPLGLLLDSKPASDPPSSYPRGLSVYSLNNTYAAANGWTQSSMVMTQRRFEDGATTAVQWQYYTNGNIVRFRSSAAGDTWGSWVDVIGVGSNKKMASGRISIPLSNAAAGSTTITFPAGLFSATPRFLIAGIGSAVMFWASSNTPTASGVGVSCRQLDGVTVTGTYSADWIAVEDG